MVRRGVVPDEQLGHWRPPLAQPLDDGQAVVLAAARAPARGPVGVGAQDHFGVEDISEILAKALNEAPAATGASEPAH